MKSFVSRLRDRLGPALLSDADFIEMAYRKVLGRPADRAGLAQYRAALRNGLGRTDLLIALVHSEEYTARLAAAARAEAGPRALRPERYRDMVDRTNGQVIGVFEVEQPTDFDWLETRILEDGYYEKPGVWNLEIDTDKRVVAEMVAAFSPTRALELGCASGAVIDCLLDYGVKAEGLDISWSALSQASPRVRWAVHHGDLMSFESSVPYDLVYGLDVFEHLNPNRLDAYVARMFQMTADGGFAFCNIPAFGTDPVFGTVFPYYLDGWETDAAAGRPFSRVHVDAKGYPIHGHLTWADVGWWANRFERAGFRREPLIEQRFHPKYDGYMARITPARRAYYVFSKNAPAVSRQAIMDRITSQPSRALAQIS
jgi:predicted TPR repeat methyltransferase